MTQTQAPPRLSVLYDVHRVSRLVGEVVERALEGQPLSGTEFALYSLLLVTGPTRVSEVAAGIAAPLATASKLLDRLEERGHVERAENPADGRSTLVELTEEGRAAQRAAAADFGVALRALHGVLGGSLDLVAWALGRLDGALQAVLAGEPAAEAEPRPTASLVYAGPPLTADEEDEVHRHIDYLRWRREHR